MRPLPRIDTATLVVGGKMGPAIMIYNVTPLLVITGQIWLALCLWSTLYHFWSVLWTQSTILAEVGQLYPF